MCTSEVIEGDDIPVDYESGIIFLYGSINVQQRRLFKVFIVGDELHLREVVASFPRFLAELLGLLRFYVANHLSLDAFDEGNFLLCLPSRVCCGHVEGEEFVEDVFAVFVVLVEWSEFSESVLKEGSTAFDVAALEGRSILVLL